MRLLGTFSNTVFQPLWRRDFWFFWRRLCGAWDFDIRGIDGSHCAELIRVHMSFRELRENGLSPAWGHLESSYYIHNISVEQQQRKGACLLGGREGDKMLCLVNIWNLFVPPTACVLSLLAKRACRHQKWKWTELISNHNGHVIIRLKPHFITNGSHKYNKYHHKNNLAVVEG